MDTRGLDLTAAAGGCKISLRVKPAAKQDTLIGAYGGRLKMTVVAPPEKGKANDAVARVLAGALNLATSRVWMIAGFTAQDKVAFIEGCSPDEVRKRLERMPRVSTGAQRDRG